MRLLIAGLIVSALVSSAHVVEEGKAAPAPKGKDVADIKSAVETYLGAWDRKDKAAVVALSVKDKDAVTFGTDRGEYWVGFDALDAAVDQQFKALESSKSTVRDLRVKILAGSNAAVATSFMDLEGRSMGEPYALKGVRFTAVLEKRNGKWLFVSSHTSVPVSGQAVKY